MKWMLAGSPAAAIVLDDVQMNERGYPTSAGIVNATGLADHYDTHVAETGTSVINYTDDSNC